MRLSLNLLAKVRDAAMDTHQIATAMNNRNWKDSDNSHKEDWEWWLRRTSCGYNSWLQRAEYLKKKYDNNAVFPMDYFAPHD
jgi:hypothetical protein